MTTAIWVRNVEKPVVSLSYPRPFGYAYHGHLGMKRHGHLGTESYIQISSSFSGSSQAASVDNQTPGRSAPLRGLKGLRFAQTQIERLRR